MPHQSPLAPLQSRTILVAAAVSLALWHWLSPDFGLGTFATALWAVVWFRSTEGLIRAAARPKGQPRNERALLGWGAVKLAVYGLAVWVLFSRPFPALSHAVGFTLMMVVLVVGGARLSVSSPPAQPRQDDDADDP